MEKFITTHLHMFNKRMENF